MAWQTVQTPTEPVGHTVKMPVSGHCMPAEKAVQAVWLGHASCLVQIEGFNFLTDPVFSQRCSPVQWLGPKYAFLFYVPALDACSYSIWRNAMQRTAVAKNIPKRLLVNC